MDCKFAEKTSLLIDGELSLEEAESIKAHIAECSECQQMEKDFLYFRQQIQESVSGAVWEAREKAQTAHFIGRKSPLWKKWISLPAPVFTALLFLLAGFGAWAIISTINRHKNLTVAEELTEKSLLEKENRQTILNEISLSRFDRGGRAEIYATRRQPSIESDKHGSDTR